MTDPVPEFRRPWFAVLALAGLLFALLAFRPGLLGDDTDRAYKALTTLGAVAAVASVAWRFHGLVAGAAVVLLLLTIDRRPLEYVAFLERGADAALIGTLALGVAVGAQPNRRRPWTWLVFAVAATALIAVGVGQWELPAAEDATARARTVHLIVGVAVLAGLVGCLGRATAVARLKVLLVWIGVPAAVIGAWRLTTGGWPMTWEAAAWPAMADEWKSDGWAEAAWCWTTPWVGVPLLAFGLWRTAARGLKQWRAGDAPLGWLVGLAGLATIVALTPRPVGRDSLALAAVGALLSVFAVADLGLAMIERIELKPPPPGPSDIPRVR
jgi:hypothetical protein